VLVQTAPLMGVLFQDAGNTAVLLAENKIGKSLSKSDVIFNINAKNQIPLIEGSSVGALMTLILISAINSNIKSITALFLQVLLIAKVNWRDRWSARKSQGSKSWRGKTIPNPQGKQRACYV